MSANVTLVVMTGCLYAAGVFLLLERSLTRVLLGVLLLGNATNVLLISSSGPAGKAPIVGRSTAEEMSDPLAQAMILTAIVITLGMAAFLLSMIYRAWQLDRSSDDVEFDLEDVSIGARTHDDDTDDDDVSAELDPDDEDYDGDATDGFLRSGVTR
jgi:multicomponent Na+:H+ antiporter subunit C